MSAGFLIGSKDATEAQIDVVLFSSKVLANLCCLQGFVHTCSQLCFGPDAVFKLLHVLSRRLFPFLKKKKSKKANF